MTIEIFPYSQEHEATWDQFCSEATNATLLHTRRFLSYHKDRFNDLSALLVDSGKIVGLFPAATIAHDAAAVISHPGATYGGIVHQGRLSGMRMVEALMCLCNYYHYRGHERLLYKTVPHIYNKVPSQDDSYALFRIGAQRSRCDLSCAIDLPNRQTPSERRRRGLKKATKVVTLSNDPSLLGDLWGVIAQNLARKHDARPVHSLDELALLHERFPEQIVIRCALLNGKVEAGVVFFNSNSIWHAQYIAASERAYEVSALDAVFEAAIDEARQAGARFFDFGTSNEDGGRVLNDGLYRFKSEFGGGGVAHDFWEIDLGTGSTESALAGSQALHINNSVTTR